MCDVAVQNNLTLNPSHPDRGLLPRLLSKTFISSRTCLMFGLLSYSSVQAARDASVYTSRQLCTQSDHSCNPANPRLKLSLQYCVCFARNLDQLKAAICLVAFPMPNHKSCNPKCLTFLRNEVHSSCRHI